MRKIVIATLLSLFFYFSAFGMKVFDMQEIRDPSTLQIKVLQDWYKVQGPIATRQKLVTINVGDLWPGQEYRIPVRMVVPRQPQSQRISPHRWKHPFTTGKGCQTQLHRA